VLNATIASNAGRVVPTGFPRADLQKNDWILLIQKGKVFPGGAVMNQIIEFVLLSLVIGAGATLAMDAWAAVLRRFGVPSLSFAFLGRWIGHLPQGRWLHDSIAKAAPIKGELWIGWCAHYAIGVSFAGLLLVVFGLKWAHSPTLGPALFIGLATVVAPLFVLQPALGAGIASSKTPRPVFNSVKSVVTHAVFGVGLYLTGSAVASLGRALG
jgi:hypothetical protein